MKRGKAVALAGLVALVAVTLLSGPAWAAPRTTPISGTMYVVPMADATPHWVDGRGGCHWRRQPIAHVWAAGSLIGGLDYSNLGYVNLNLFPYPGYPEGSGQEWGKGTGTVAVSGGPLDGCSGEYRMTFNAKVTNGVSSGKATLHFVSGDLKGMKAELRYTLSYWPSMELIYSGAIHNPHGDK